jgi:hypothetical protein
MKSLMDICAGIKKSASIQCWRTRHAGSSRPISIRRLGEMTLLPSCGLARYVVFLQRLSAPAPAMVGMCGFSSLGNSLFLNANFEPHADQWSFLSTLRRMTSAEVTAIAEEAGRQGKVVGLRLPFDEEDEEPWAAPPSRRRPELPIAGPLPKTIDAVLADQIYIPRAGLPGALTNRLIRIAAFQNPAFYSAQAMQLSIFGIPRVVACAEVLSHHIALPRGCREPMQELLAGLNVDVRWRDERNAGRAIEVRFLGALTKEQETATTALLRYETGTLAATTGFGKTVVAAAMIAARKVSTLILVHRRQLMEQWGARLQTFLKLSQEGIGQIGGGVRKLTGLIDVAMIQSLAHRGVVDDLVADYGQVIVDECHHLSAVRFEAVARRAKARFVLRPFRHRHSQGWPSPTHLHATRAGAVPRRCEIRGGRATIRSSGRAAQNVLYTSAGA